MKISKTSAMFSTYPSIILPMSLALSCLPVLSMSPSRPMESQNRNLIFLLLLSSAVPPLTKYCRYWRRRKGQYFRGQQFGLNPLVWISLSVTFLTWVVKLSTAVPAFALLETLCLNTDSTLLKNELFPAPKRKIFLRDPDFNFNGCFHIKNICCFTVGFAHKTQQQTHIYNPFITSWWP